MAVLGVPPRVAMELLDHSQIGTLMNIYSHVAQEYQRQAINQVGATLWEASANGESRPIVVKTVVKDASEVVAGTFAGVN